MTETPRQQIEHILGGKISPFDEQELPGVVPLEGSEVVFFSETAGSGLYEQFDRLTEAQKPPLMKFGGVSTTKHTLTLPDGQIFHAIKYRGDLEGWRRQIREGARALDVVLGRIEQGSKFVLSDGREFALADCVHGRLHTGLGARP